MAAAQASRDADALRGALIAARDTAEKDAVDEVLLQSYLFLGFPAALWAFGIWSAVLPRDPADTATPTDRLDEKERWAERGRAVCRLVYGENYDKLRRNVEALSPELDLWMIAEGYGKVLGRPGLRLRVRELCVVAALVVTAWEPQLHSHLRGALNAGATNADVEEVVEIALGYVADSSWEARVRQLWSEIAGRDVC